MRTTNCENSFYGVVLGTFIIGHFCPSWDTFDILKEHNKTIIMLFSIGDVYYWTFMS